METILRAVMRRKTLVGFLFVLIFGGYLGHSYYFQERYETEVLLSLDASRDPIQLNIGQFDVMENMQLAKSHKIKLTSDIVLKRLLVKLDLFDHEEFRMREWFPPRILHGVIPWLFPDYKILEDGRIFPRDEVRRITRILREKTLVIDEVPFTNFLKIRVRGNNPSTVEKIAGALPAEYILFINELRRVDERKILYFLKDEVFEQSERVREFEDQIETFKQEQGIKLVDFNRIQTGRILDNLGQHETETRNLQIETSQLFERKVQTLPDEIKGFIKNFESTAQYQSIFDTIEKLEIKRAILLKSFTINHPNVTDLDQTLRNTKNQLIDSARGDFRDRYPGFPTADLFDLEKAIEYYFDLIQLDIRQKVLRRITNDIYEKNWEIKERFLPDEEKKLGALLRQLVIAENNYKFLVGEMEKARIAFAKNEKDEIKIIQPGSLPYKRTGNPLVNLPLVFCIWIFSSVALSWLFESQDTTFGTPTHQAADRLGLKLLGTLPYRRSLLNSRLKISRTQTHDIQSFQAVVDADFHQAQAVAVTSSLPREGKTFVALNLARQLGNSGRKVLLVDAAGFQSGSLKSILRAPNSFACSRLAEDAELNPEAPDGEPFYFLYLNDSEHQVLKDVASDAFHLLMQRLVGGFDYILYDTPDVKSSAVALYLARLADQVILVVESEKTKFKTVKQSIHLLNGTGPREIGLFLNKVRYHIPAFLYKKVH